MSTDIALVNIGYLKEAWIVPKNLTTLVVRGSVRIHKPAIEGLFGLQHTLEGIKSEIKILQELKRKNLLHAQIPVANNLGEYITEYKLDNFNHPCYATVLEWIEGSTLTLKENNIKEIAYKLGQNLALFHKCLKEFKPSQDFIRPIYDVDRIERDNQRNSWIKTSALEICDTLCKDFVDGKEVFYSL